MGANLQHHIRLIRTFAQLSFSKETHCPSGGTGATAGAPSARCCFSNQSWNLHQIFQCSLSARSSGCRGCAANQLTEGKMKLGVWMWKAMEYFVTVLRFPINLYFYWVFLSGDILILLSVLYKSYFGKKWWFLLWLKVIKILKLCL